MPNLRDIIDDKVICAAAPRASKPSSVAQHVASHIQDPLGSTKQDFQDLSEKKLAYDQSRAQAQMNLAPVQSVLDHASQLHGLTIPRSAGMMPGTPGMDLGQPGQGPQNNDSNNPVDEQGNPTPGAPGAIIGKPMPGNGKNPGNMSQTTGKMNSNRPSLAGFQPGVSPGPAESVRPTKLGQAQPGKQSARNSPQPNNSGNMYNKQAAPPKGNRTLPGAKGPGDSKVENQTKKANAKSAREIKVHVSASAIPYDINRGGSKRLETQLGMASLCGTSVRHTSRSMVAAADMGSNALRDLLQESLKDKFGGNGNVGCSPVGSYAWIAEVYPMDNYFVYNSDGKNYKQSYTIVDGDVVLKGDPVKVKQAYVKAMSMPGSGAMPKTSGFNPTGSRGMVGTPVRNKILSRKVKAGPSSLSDKVADPQHDVAYNPVMRGGKRVGKMRTCGTCGMKASKCTCMKATGHSLGAKKGWSTRNKGHLSKVEKAAHYNTMDAGGPGSGRHSTGRSTQVSKRIRYLRDRLKQPLSKTLDIRKSKTDLSVNDKGYGDQHSGNY